MIERHKTAIKRVNLSKPLQIAIASGLLDNTSSMFDYGCGRGDDLKKLIRLGYNCSGWDPAHKPNTSKVESDIVNLGYVVNVIEDQAERKYALLEAWKITKHVLIVSARLSIELKQGNYKSFGDGHLSSKGTFQKFYNQQELRDWIDESLGVRSTPAAPGIFLVFKSEEKRETYAASKYRRIPAKIIGRKSDELFEEHKELLEPLISFFSDRGRLPSEHEIDVSSQLKGKLGSIKNAFAIIRRVTGNAQWEEIVDARSMDLLVYLALSCFGGRPVFSKLPTHLQLDVKAFWGSYKKGCEKADQLLFSTGNLDLISKACQAATVGKLTYDALYIHSSAVGELQPILRVYEGCARAYIGDVSGANIIKLHRHNPQISYLSYPEFDEDPHPALNSSLVVPLRTFNIQHYDYSESSNPPILHRKEHFVPDWYMGKAKFTKLTKSEEKAGLYENTNIIGTRNGWLKVLTEKAVSLRGHRLVKLRKTENTSEKV